ncbi:restriction endonuclease subunit S [Glaesserella parasuis]|uniref:restriction endonuclease subunit S n=1 Tax=Glaesserella parasuis TaxID=738 RepID=UPI002436FDB8|nr:restriction endonuclease subunit S [Glaesserella parasuis]MDG6795638.1 restriction endonuclease subunit S [Glaesserella parasuis]MDG6872776.1 restriction endonuclease subunit S [Glaesserella parasuis]
MSSWKTIKLSECVFFQEGYVNPSKLESSYFGGAIKWLRATDLNDGFVYETSQTLTEKGFNSAGKSALLFEPNTIAISKSGTIGRLGILKDYMCGNRAVINIKTNLEKADSRFIFYVLRNNRSRIIELADGSVQKNLYTSALGKLEFKLPELEEQYNISSILSSMDDKIQLNTQINQTLEQIAQTIFKSWFIDFDPVHAKANALASGQTLEQATQVAMAVISGKNTQELHRLQTANPEQYQQLWEIAEAFPSGFSGYKNLGEIPIGWNVLTFKDFISESKEKIGSLEDVPEYSVGNEGIYPRSEKYNKSLSKTPEKNKVVRIGDLVFGMGSKTLNWGIMNDEIGSVSPAYFVYRIFTNINYIYLNKYIKAKEYDFQNLIKPTSRQGQSVDKEMFLKKEIYVPNEYLLNIYLNKLKEIDSLVYSYTTEVLILEQIRDELLPKLLSGEI